MSQEIINLYRPEFELKVQTVYSQLLKSNDFTDVTLATEDDKQIKAHKIILSSSSHFFHNVLMKNSHEHPLIYLKDIKHQQLEMLLKFIYQGQCEMKAEEVEEFLVTGKSLGVEGLLESRQSAKDRKHLTKPHTQNQNIGKNKTNIQINHTNSFDKQMRAHSFGQDGNSDKAKTVKNSTETPIALELSVNEQIIIIEKEENVFSQQLQLNMDGMYVCNMCNTQFSLRGLDRHMTTKHKKDMHMCDLCEDNFVTSGLLISHLKSKHSTNLFNRITNTNN
jgi:hypothetical protein